MLINLFYTFSFFLIRSALALQVNLVSSSAHYVPTQSNGIVVRRGQIFVFELLSTVQAVPQLDFVWISGQQQFSMTLSANTANNYGIGFKSQIENGRYRVDLTFPVNYPITYFAQSQFSLGSDIGPTVPLTVLSNPYHHQDQAYFNHHTGYSVQHGINQYMLTSESLMTRDSQNRSVFRWELDPFDEATKLVAHHILQQHDSKVRSDLKSLTRVIAEYMSRIISAKWALGFQEKLSPQALKSLHGWGGSKEIFQLFVQNGFRHLGQGHYAQCWIYTGMLNSILRYIGIPSRSVTNFGSFMPSNHGLGGGSIFVLRNNTHVHAEGGTLFTFHMWVESYFKIDGVHDWQILDATPSGGNWGPTPRHMIKEMATRIYQGNARHTSMNSASHVACEVNCPVEYFRLKQNHEPLPVIPQNYENIHQGRAGFLISTEGLNSVMVDVTDQYKDLTVMPRSHETELIDVAVEATVGKPFKLTFTRPLDDMMPEWKFSVSFSTVTGNKFPSINSRLTLFKENEVTVSEEIHVADYMEIIKLDSFKVIVSDSWENTANVIKETDVNPTMPSLAIDNEYKHQPSESCVAPGQLLSADSGNCLPKVDATYQSQLPSTNSSPLGLVISKCSTKLVEQDPIPDHIQDYIKKNNINPNEFKAIIMTEEVMDPIAFKCLKVSACEVSYTNSFPETILFNTHFKVSAKDSQSVYTPKWKLVPGTKLPVIVITDRKITLRLVTDANIHDAQANCLVV